MAADKIGPNTKRRQMKSELFDSDIFENTEKVPANDNEKAKSANDNKKTIEQKLIDNKILDKKKEEEKALKYAKHLKEGGSLGLPKNLEKIADPSKRFAENEKFENANDNNNFYRTLKNKAEIQKLQYGEILQDLIEQDEIERAIAYQQMIEQERIQKLRSLKYELSKKYRQQMQGHFKNNSVSISAGEASRLLNSDMKIYFPFIMFGFAILKDISDIFVSIISLALTPVFGIGIAINFVYKGITFIYTIIFFVWSSSYGVSGKAKKITNLKKKLFIRFLKKRSWTMILEIIPLIESLPMNTYNVFYIYNSYSKIVRGGNNIYKNFKQDVDKVSKSL
jgi:hypothetical protein